MEGYNIQDNSTVLSLEREDTQTSVKEALLQSKNPSSNVDRHTFTSSEAPKQQPLRQDTDDALKDTEEKASLLQTKMAQVEDDDVFETVEEITTVEEVFGSNDGEKSEKSTGEKPKWRRNLDTAKTKLVTVHNRATSAYRTLQQYQPVPPPAPKPKPEPIPDEKKPAWRKVYEFFCVYDDRRYNYLCLYIGYGNVVLGLILVVLGSCLLWLYGNKRASSVYGLPIWLGLLLIIVAGLIIANSKWQQDIDEVTVENEAYEEIQEEKKKEEEMHEEEKKLLEEIVVETPQNPEIVVNEEPQNPLVVVEEDPNKRQVSDDVIGPFYGACLEETELLDENGQPVKLTEDEVYASLLEAVPADEVRSIQCIRRLWRLYFHSEDVKNQIVANGIRIKGELVNVLDYTTFTLKKKKSLRKPATPSPRLVKLTITALPDSVEDSHLRKGLVDLGCKVKGEVERLSLVHNGQETFCHNGTRVVYVEKADGVRFRKNMVFCGHRVCVTEETMSGKANTFEANGNTDPIPCYPNENTASGNQNPEEENGNISNGSRLGSIQEDSGIQTPDSGFQTPEIGGSRSRGLPLQLPVTLEENCTV